MCNKRFMSIVFLAIVGVVLLVFSLSQAAPALSSPEGTFVLTVTAKGTPPFQELITLHKGGTISETNTTLHPNSANEFFPFNGSDGYGAWERGFAGTVNLKFLRPVKDGDSITVTGAVSGTEEIEGGTKVSVDLFCDNQNGDRTAVGIGTAVIR